MQDSQRFQTRWAPGIAHPTRVHAAGELTLYLISAMGHVAREVNALLALQYLNYWKDLRHDWSSTDNEAATCSLY